MDNVEIPQWLKLLPLAPEFRPTDTEFADPIAYISKIEKEASAFGICKVIPPLPKPSKRYVFNNLNKSLVKSREFGSDVHFAESSDSSKRSSQDKMNESDNRAVFTTRQQELGQDSKRSKEPGAQKQVWQSGELYTLEQFESKSKAFSRSVLGMIKVVTPLVIEALFWKAALEKPIYVEYANDVPGSGFAEPEGSLGYANAHKRRRRVCSQSYRGRSYGRQLVVNTASNLCTGVEVQELGPSLSPVAEIGKECIDRPTSPPNETSQSTKPSGLCANSEPEGTAGWKLSNCPWNLQVIARSAGSLTRFMLDDIPGVTSPMVYIGMLFSWFAWHVEDHELHSLNFMHTGSPKTWYAVPGEYAFAFEDVIRKQAYGENVGHLAALKRLGEKTTLLSPEIVVASGIPCCRLVQNPGEFVVTFPRAYHVGFSHGFNCGEAANFGTPLWLSIAKEAAVRRAAMDHLPMLSHQQLLYLLTMSFISRVPRTLLPGVRSSRLKNRLKEERELLVKKAFIEDMVKENLLLNTLLGKDSAFRAVLWHPDSLPSFARDSLSQAGTTLVGILNKDAGLSVLPPKGANHDVHHRTSYRTPDDLYMDSSDLLGDFQVDSGTLVCVACGILGYPIMSVVQPSKGTSVDSFAAGVVHIPQQAKSSHMQYKTKISLSETNNDGTWDTSGFLRPRIFCLEHAVQIVELLKPKGGAKMLVICHSDYQKIKANAVAVAEELRATFNYKEVQLDSASQEELNLIDVAIDDEQLTDFKEDWTSKLGINLRFSIKARKSCLPKKIEHVLNIDYILSVMAPVSRISNIKWCSRRSRSKRESHNRTLAKYCDGNISKKDQTIYESNSVEMKGKVLLQYSRRKYRAKSRNFTGVEFASGCSLACLTEVTDADCGKNANGVESETLRSFCIKNAGEDSKDFDTSKKHLVVYDEVEIPEANMERASNRTSEVLAITEASTSSDSCFLGIVGECEGSNKENEELPATAMPDAGTSSTAGKDMRGENGCEAKVSKLSTMCRPKELNQEHAVGNVRVSSITDCAFDTSHTPVINGSSVPDSARVKVHTHGTFDRRENLGESETYKHDNFSTFFESTTTMEVDMPVLPNCSLTDSSQTGVLVTSLSNTWEGKDRTVAKAEITCGDRTKRKREGELQPKTESSFMKSPCEGLRPRKCKEDPLPARRSNVREIAEAKSPIKKRKKHLSSSVSCNEVLDNETTYRCNLEGCRMHFRTRVELSLHKRNKCHQKDCGKKFRSHKYVVLHQRVHDDERPLKCTWTGCTMTFKWAWARTEHLRLHTGERPYHCKIKGCGLTFRFVSDFSRHRRKTGHYVHPPSK
ncbi:hypothetical protein BVRB_6g156070 [Beta vulgaris subsp. vulgaris]|uniref:Lysine-specific demethylase ELF6 n=1 Tax=Beta vulgaris subsp. vulgaris TaxID=3555 RepID=A0A0J8BBE0_BETVV|nr:hypothetical protein BVRB_6g156070 [Beta vulgaris subsp. vulgaris]